jgi:hypothetical protein
MIRQKRADALIHVNGAPAGIFASDARSIIVPEAFASALQIGGNQEQRSNVSTRGRAIRTCELD